MTRLKLLVFVSVVLGVAALAHTRAAEDREDGDHDTRVARGFEIAPVPLHFQQKDRQLVGLGSYLVNAVGGCVDCHTNPTYAHGGDPFMGQPKVINATHYLAGGAQFGPFTSRNLTREANGLPEGHTFDEFLQIMRHGTDFEHQHPQFGPLLQVMPWPVYQSMTDRDLRAIYEYLRAVPPALPCLDVSPTAIDPTCRP
jgi:hypothetical protein